MARGNHVEINEGRLFNALGVERPKELHRALVGDDAVVDLLILYGNDGYLASRPVLAFGRPPQRATVPIMPTIDVCLHRLLDLFE